MYLKISNSGSVFALKLTSFAVFLTSSSSPSKAASSNKARGSKLTLRGFLAAPFIFRLPFLTLRRAAPTAVRSDSWSTSEETLLSVESGDKEDEFCDVFPIGEC